MALMAGSGLQVRLLAFIAVLLADAVFVRRQPWPVVVGCIAYLLLILLPMAHESQRRSRGSDR
jgi:hypothetical protein